MARGATHVLGVEIGSQPINKTECRFRHGAVELVGRPVVCQTPPGLVQGGFIEDPTTVGAAIKEHLRSFSVRRAVASVGGQSHLVIRLLEMPAMPESDLRKEIYYELERQTPFPPDQVYYDYQVVQRADADPNASHMEVLLAAAQEELIESHVAALEAAGLTPMAIDVEPLALSRSLVNILGDEMVGQTVAIVNVGNTTCDIVIVRHGLLSFVRPIPTAGEAVSRAIGQAFVIEAEEAERVKREVATLDIGPGFGPPGAVPEAPDTGSLDLGATTPTGGTSVAYDDSTDASVFELSSTDTGVPEAEMTPTGDRATHLDLDEAVPPPGPSTDLSVSGVPPSQGTDMARQQIYDTIVPVITEVTTELRRSLDFYRRQHRNENIDRIILCGGSALLPGLAQFVAADVGIYAELADPFARLAKDPSVAPDDYLRDIGPSCAVAVGLALRDSLLD